MATIDIIIVIAFLVGITLVGFWQMKGKNSSSDNFFLAGRSLKWPMIGLSLFAANISTIHLVGLASSGFNEGMVWGVFEWLAVVSLLFLAFVFAPFYFKSKISTLPEFLELRYDARSRTVFAFIAILSALFVHIGISLYTGAIIFQRFFGIGVWTSIIIIASVTLCYYLAGGLKAVVYTQSVQTIVLLSGSVILTILGLNALGDYMNELGMSNSFFENFSELVRQGQLSVLHTQSSIDSITETINTEYTSNGFDPLSSSGLTWYAALLGYPILGFWYWCSDQTIVQQVLGAKTLDDSQRGPLFAGFLKLTTPLIMVLPGVIAYILFKNDVFEASMSSVPPCSKPGDMALNVLVEKLLPTGLKGLFSAALLAALMSTIAAALNSVSTLVSIDIVKRIKPSISDAALMKVGRLSAIVIIIIAALWSTQGDKFSSVFEAINKFASALAPPVAVVLLMGVLYKRGTKEASLYTLLTGLLLGVTCFILDFKFTADGTAYITDVLGIPFMMQAWWLFCICMVVYLAVSAVTPKPPTEITDAYVWKNIKDIFKPSNQVKPDLRIVAILLIITLILICTFFTLL